jgi:hypothetical protein
MWALKKSKNIFLSIITIHLFLCQTDRRAFFPTSPNPEQIQLAAILNRIREYCRRLEKGAFDFVCLEEISEKIDRSRDYYGVSRRGFHKYVYDYQLIKKEGDAKEKRILLEKNGSKTHEENAPLETEVFRHQFVLLRTADLFNEFGDNVNDYRLVGEDLVSGEEALVLEAAPKPAYEQRFLYGTEPSYLYGKIWVRKKDYGILKVAWNPKVIRDFINIEEFAKKIKSEPLVTIVTEYNVEKNGIRFPSRLFIEEAYIHPEGKKFVRSRTEILYKDYKFFTVETEVKYD